IQEDCNTVLYYKTIVLWVTGTNGLSFDYKLRLQEDGNLVLYSAFDSKALFSTGTYCRN
ncbi:hypothetical protein SELMODRAFT_19074, partial [Selaginella moellendorffii]